ncbi:MAG: SAM-dependent DNA methyltransferase [Planctomycetes bacterium]|nr:SAM-dependent DNA methyltransferase [Planctomycetota bacterium]
MAKEQFFYPATQPLFKKLEQLSQRSAVSRGQAFEDFLTAIVCALAAETKEDEYLTMVERHTKGKQGNRGIDLMPQMFGELVNAMSREDNDVLGDLFQGAVSYGENALYVTPAPVARLMSRMAMAIQDGDRDSTPPTISDPCCGTGILLMEAGKISPNSELVGQDIDARKT